MSKKDARVVRGVKPYQLLVAAFTGAGVLAVLQAGLYATGQIMNTIDIVFHDGALTTIALFSFILAIGVGLVVSIKIIQSLGNDFDLVPPNEAAAEATSTTTEPAGATAGRALGNEGGDTDFDPVEQANQAAPEPGAPRALGTGAPSGQPTSGANSNRPHQQQTDRRNRPHGERGPQSQERTPPDAVTSAAKPPAEAIVIDDLAPVGEHAPLSATA